MGGSIAEKNSNLYYMFGMADNEKPVEKTLMASLSATITSQDSMNSNPVTIMVDSGASDHDFNLAIICDEPFNDWGGRGCDNSVPGVVIETAPSGYRTA